MKGKENTEKRQDIINGLKKRKKTWKEGRKDLVENTINSPLKQNLEKEEKECVSCPPSVNFSLTLNTSDNANGVIII